MGGCFSSARSSAWRLARAWWLGSCFALFAMVCPLTWSNSDSTEPPTPPLTSQSYLDFKADLLTLKQQRDAYRTSLTQALQQKRSIEQMLAAATLKYEDLLSSVTQHSNDSTTSSAQLLQEIQRLTLLLSASESSALRLRANLESTSAEYDRRIAEAILQATGLERSLKVWKMVGKVALVGVPVALAGGILIGVLLAGR